MHPVALDILQTLVRYSRTPMSSLLIDNAFPAAIQCILRTDDNSVMQVRTKTNVENSLVFVLIIYYYRYL